MRASGDTAYERVTDYAYDGFGRLRREIQYPAWPSTTATLATAFTYDLAGNRATLTDPLGQTTTFSYDALGRLTRIDYSDPGTRDVTYTYDVHGNRTAMTTGVTTTSYSYDELDRLLTAGPVGYRYDRDGQRTKILYSGGLVTVGAPAVEYVFDAAGRVASVADWEAKTVGYEYFADGRVRTQTNVNGTTATYAYDNARRLTEVWNRTVSGATISRHTYALNARGERTRTDEVLPVLSQPLVAQTSRSTSYAYDALSRLISAVDVDVSTTYATTRPATARAARGPPEAAARPSTTATTVPIVSRPRARRRTTSTPTATPSRAAVRSVPTRSVTTRRIDSSARASPVRTW